MRKYSKFTLLEMLAVIAIIVILISASIVGYNMAMKFSREAATKSTIMKLELALNQLYQKYGVYPPEKDNGNRYFEIDIDQHSLNGHTTLNGHSLKNNNYISDLIKLLDIEDMNVERINTNSDGTIERFIILDAWDQPLVYRTHANKINQGAFDIISAGNDMVWTVADIATKGSDLDYDIDDFPEDSSDDIANFNLDK